MRKPAREAVQSSSYHNFVRAGIPVVPKLPERDEDDFVTLPSSQGWSAGAPLPTSVSEVSLQTSSLRWILTVKAVFILAAN